MSNGYTMRQARDILERAVVNSLTHGQNRVIYLEGDPGLGKTALAHSVYASYRRYKNDDIKAESYWVNDQTGETSLTQPKGKDWGEVNNIHHAGGYTHFVPYVAPERDVTDWGLPFPNADRKNITMLPLSDFDYQPTDRPFLFLDEIDKAPQMMQNVLGRVMHERRIGSIVFPEGTFVMAAGNKMSNRAGSVSANTHIKNRRSHTPVIADAIEFIEDVGIPWGLHGSVISYLRTDPKMIHVMDTSAPSFPSPRSWTKVGLELNTPFDADKPWVERAMIEGDIGVEAANTFWGHLQIYRNLRPLEVIVASPDKIDLPKGASATATMWAEVTMLARHASKQNVEAICTYINRLPSEFSYCGYRDMMARDKALVASSKKGLEWINKNKTTLLNTARA